LNPLSPEWWREIVAEACRAPSAHNVQPARWRFGPGRRVELLRARDRTLPAGDPSGRDIRASVGAAFEGTALALSRRGFGLTEPVLTDEWVGPNLRLVAIAHLMDDVAEDPLAQWAERRRAFRGVFAHASHDVVRAIQGLEAEDARVITAGGDITRLARAYDAAHLGFLARPEFEAELYEWLRLLKSHPDRDRDGLTAPCLALSPFQAWLGHQLLRPDRFRWVRRFGLAGALLSEAVPIRSAAALILFAPPREDDPFYAGRRLYRLWLEVTRVGCALCPLTSLADDESTARDIARRFAIPAVRRLANVFRVGVAPREPGRSPRLPVDELIVGRTES
jgi:hypothetical protein